MCEFRLIDSGTGVDREHEELPALDDTWTAKLRAERLAPRAVIKNGG
ncbi:MAG: hypothetical protein H0T78_10120 [Longispora sp.]|nr:hypothetical protein [Longispora sp. (in: high G+C Gram-positive bacteria)]